MFRIRIWGTRNEMLTGENGEPIYLKSYDPDGNNGHGDIEITFDPLEAKLFDTSSEAMDEWMKVSTVLPVRPDGKPNRPLSAYTIETEPSEDTNVQI